MRSCNILIRSVTVGTQNIVELPFKSCNLNSLFRVFIVNKLHQVYVFIKFEFRALNCNYVAQTRYSTLVLYNQNLTSFLSVSFQQLSTEQFYYFIIHWYLLPILV